VKKSFELISIDKKIHIHYHPPFKSKNYEIISKKFDASKAFQHYQKHNEEHCGLGDLNVTNK
jgi:hypothetical protein